MLIHDLRFTSRLLRKHPGMGVLVIVALLFGIGVNTTVFSVVNAVLLRPLAISEPDRVVLIRARVNQTGGILGISYPEFIDWKTQNHAFESITALRAFSFYSSGNGAPEHLKGSSGSADVFKVFGVKTVLGRSFVESDDRSEAQRVVILSHSFWVRKFGSDPKVLGRSLTLDDQAYTIIGVLQPTQLGMLQYPDVWVPNAFFVDQTMQSRDSRYYFPIGRLRSNVTQAEALAEMETIAARLADQYPASNKDMGVRLVGLVDQLTAGGRKPLTLLFTASSLIFLLTCVNILIVLLSGTAERGRELSIQLALGCSRFRVLRQLFFQALILTGAGSILGLAVAKLSLVFFLRRFPGSVLRFQETTLDYRVIGFMAAMALVTTLLATALPAWYASRLNINDELKGQSVWRSSSRFRSFRQGALIIIEVTLASGLALVSGLLIKSFYEVAKIDLGFSPHRVFSFQINLPTRYKGAQQSEFYKRAIERLSNQPGMSLSSGVETLPLTTQGNVINIQADDQSPSAGERPIVEYDSVLPAFFATMRQSILEGRDFTDADHTDALPVVIVDDALAAKFWPGQNAIGKRLRLLETADSQAPWREVIGVVRETRHFGPEAKVRWMQVYVPEYQVPTPVLSFVVDTPLPEAPVKAAAERTIHELDAGLPVDNFQSMDTLLDGYMAGRKVTVLLVSLFAGVALLLGAIGIYGVVSNSILRRRREIAVRMALGATRRAAILLVARLGLFSTVAGILLGVALVLSLTRVLASFLYGVTMLNPGVYAVSAAIITTLSVVAALMPARSVLKLDPQKILRE